MNEWQKLENNLYYDPAARLMLEYGGMAMDEAFLAAMEPAMGDALAAMDELEKGAVANPDEGRMVGHYWLRAPELAPTEALREEIVTARRAAETFAADVAAGRVLSQRGEKFRYALVAGMGGSSLGPAFVYDAMRHGAQGLGLYFLDNTDPAGMDAIFSEVEPALDETLVIVISKSGGTIETRNAMEEARAYYTKRGLDFAKHAVCVTGVGSKLDALVRAERWLAVFPMWDWVGGRTSVMSAVGLVPLALAGVDTDAFLRGAAACDRLGRAKDWRRNPAAIMALAWYRASGGKGGESMVVLPYRDSLVLFAKYLQQLIMESLGKEFDLDGREVHQGLAVFGNKGSADQHSYVQQLVGGPYNVFTTFVQVLQDREGPSLTVGEESTSGDYLNAFMLGTKKALEDHGKLTMTVAVPDASAFSVGALIALFERVVGLYAQLIHVNAYHQPAVEFGKKAANGLIALKNEARAYLAANAGRKLTAPELADALGQPERAADLFRLLLHLAANDPALTMEPAEPITESRFGC